jgi:hypothetical protein
MLSLMPAKPIVFIFLVYIMIVLVVMYSDLSLFTVDGRLIDFVSFWSHLSLVLRSDLCDDDDVESRRLQTVKQTSDVLCHFGKLDAIVELQLLETYCNSIYGCELWDVSCTQLAPFCVSWCRRLKMSGDSQLTHMHDSILFGLCSKRPVVVELKVRSFKFILTHSSKQLSFSFSTSFVRALTIRV